MTFRRVQEVLNEISFSRFLEQVDSKIWRVHLLLYDSELISKLTITERKQQKRRAISDPASLFAPSINQEV